MNLDRMYSDVCTMIYEHCGTEDAEKLISSPHGFLGGTGFWTSAAETLISLRGEMDARTTGRTSLAALRRIISDTSRVDLRGVITDGTTWCVTDGRRMVRLLHDVPSLPHASGNLPYADIIEKTEKGGEMEIPAETEVRAWIAGCRARGQKKCLDGIQMGESLVNPQYLLDMLQSLPHCRAYRPAGPAAPIYMQADCGDGLLLPMLRR